jgi:hypothetical protein
MSGEARLEALKRAAREYLDLRLRFSKRSDWLAIEEGRALLELLDRHPVLEEVFPDLRQKLESWIEWYADSTAYEKFIGSCRKRIDEAKTVEEVLKVLEDVDRERFEREFSGPKEVKG